MYKSEFKRKILLRKKNLGEILLEMISQILKNPREKILERKNFKENAHISKIYR